MMKEKRIDGRALLLEKASPHTHNALRGRAIICYVSQPADMWSARQIDGKRRDKPCLGAANE